jgi:mannose-1-phosphate guanylyltransferase
VKALVLAGGYGTRLRPLTYTRPKHLLPVANRPHIEHVLALFERHGINEIVFLTSYLAEAFNSVLHGEAGRNLVVDIVRETEPLGTAGAIKNAQAFVGRDTFVVFNGDILTDFDIGAALRFHWDRGAEATILLVSVEEPSAYGVVPTAPDGRIMGFVEKPPPGKAPTNFINAGVYIFEPTVLRNIPTGEVWSAEHQLFPGLVDTGAAFYGLEMNGYWMDIGTPAKYLKANIDVLKGRFLPQGGGHLQENASLIAEGAHIYPNSEITSSCVATESVVEEGASVTESVLLRNARVSSEAIVTSCVLGEGSRVEAGGVAAGQVLGDGEILGLRSSRENGLSLSAPI